MTRTVQTTTLIVMKPTDFSLLEKEYKLFRYVLPDSFRYRLSKNRNIYGQMHNSLRDQLDYPYKTFKYDRLENGITRWVVYVLYPRNIEPQPITIPFLSNSHLPESKIPFTSLDLHLLLKLLHIAYFRGVNSEAAGRFIGQDNCYIYAKHDRKKGAYVCLEIDVKGDIRNQSDQDTQEFKVVGHARPFKRVESTERQSYAYFGSRIKDVKRYFIHLKRSEIEKAVQANEPIYIIRTQEKKRTTLAFHDQLHIEACVGKILYDFTRDFRGYLAQYGILSTSKERTFTEVIPPKKLTQLPLQQLSTVYIYDNRLGQKYSLQQCLDLFSKLVSEVSFVPILDLSNVQDRAVLIVQDHNREDFEEDGILQDLVDPYDILYQKFASLPKQSISINSNEQAGITAEEYLDYTLPNGNDETFKQKLEVALFQLYLKEVILYGRSVEQYLPLAPTSYVFIRKNRYYSNTYETLLYFDNDKPHFLDLRDPNAVAQRDELFGKLGVNWYGMYNKMQLKYRKNEGNEEENQLSGYDVIVGPGFFVELEDLNERILYNYDEILVRQDAVDTAIPINDLKFTQYYDRVRSRTNELSYSELQSRALLDGQIQPKSDKEKSSVDLYQRLVRYDDFLDNVARNRVVLSFNDLTQGELWERIIHIFDIKPDKNGRLTKAVFKALYQKLGWFSSDKAKELHLYEGIWHDEDSCYMIGSAQSMKLQQPRAHLIRHFHVYMGAEHFDIHPLLLSMSVQFVRYKQYTVYPYPFHLIDIYAENVLRFQ